MDMIYRWVSARKTNSSGLAMELSLSCINQSISHGICHGFVLLCFSYPHQYHLHHLYPHLVILCHLNLLRLMAVLHNLWQWFQCWRPCYCWNKKKAAMWLSWWHVGPAAVSILLWWTPEDIICSLILWISVLQTRYGANCSSKITKIPWSTSSDTEPLQKCRVFV